MSGSLERIDEDFHPFLPPLNETVTSWRESVAKGGDPRLAHLPFMGSSVPVTLIIMSYVIFVKYLGPKMMSSRRPMDLTRVILAYNLVMVILSATLFVRGGIFGWFGDYNYSCQPIDYSYSRDGYGMALTAYVYFLSKIIELLDTVFFVLRKKNNQISTLHVTHHASVAYMMYWGVKYFPGGHGSFQGFANSFVHTIMYGYYFLAALGPSWRHLLWWKKYLTIIQMVQFVAIFLHAIQIFLVSDCDFPVVMTYPYLVVVAYFMVMFVNFYRNAYNGRSERKKRRLAEIESQRILSDRPSCLLVDLQDKIHGQSVSLVRRRIQDEEHELDKTSSKKIN